MVSPQPKKKAKVEGSSIARFGSAGPSKLNVESFLSIFKNLINFNLSVYYGNLAARLYVAYFIRSVCLFLKSTTLSARHIFRLLKSYEDLSMKIDTVLTCNR